MNSPLILRGGSAEMWISSSPEMKMLARRRILTPLSVIDKVKMVLAVRRALLPRRIRVPVV
jgi:hypothetical protein